MKAVLLLSFLVLVVALMKVNAKPASNSFCASLALATKQVGDKVRRSMGLSGHKVGRGDYSALLGAYEECLRASEGIRFKKSGRPGNVEAIEDMPQRDYSPFAWAKSNESI